MPKVKHRSGGRSIEVPAALVNEYVSQGWVVQTNTPTKKATARKRATKSTTRTPDSEGTP